MIYRSGTHPEGFIILLEGEYTYDGLGENCCTEIIIDIDIPGGGPTKRASYITNGLVPISKTNIVFLDA